jgi:hypothetical protein
VLAGAGLLRHPPADPRPVHRLARPAPHARGRPADPEPARATRMLRAL